MIIYSHLDSSLDVQTLSRQDSVNLKKKIMKSVLILFEEQFLEKHRIAQVPHCSYSKELPSPDSHVQLFFSI